MGRENPVVHATIALSGSVTGDIGIIGSTVVGIHAPTVTSCQIFFQGNYNTTSAGFVRIGKKDGTGDFSWDLGPGSNAVNLSEELSPFNHLRLETSVAQAAVRSFAILTKLS